MCGKPMVSVIVPNYNYAQYLPDRIESILNQTYQDFELILLDDCSTDNSREVLESYRNNPHVTHIVFNEQNTGSPFHQWIKGVYLAQGKYIWIAEADDLAEKTFLETNIRLLRENPNAVASLVGSIFIDSEGNRMSQRANYWERCGMKKYREVGHRLFDGRFFATHKLYYSCCIQNTSAAIFVRENALKLPNMRFLEMRNSGDWLFWFQIAMQGEIIEIYQNLNYFRQHNKKASVNGRRSGIIIEEDIEVVQYMEKEIPEINQYQRQLCHGRIWRKIKRSSCDDNTKHRLRKLLQTALNSYPNDYTTFTLNHYLRHINPFLITMQRERKKLPKM